MQSRPNRPPAPFAPAGTGLVSSHLIRDQMLSPSTSTCPAGGGPISLTHVGLGLGSFAHSPPGTLGPPPFASPFTGRYGFGRPDCAAGRTTPARRTKKAQAAVNPTRVGWDMITPSFQSSFLRSLGGRHCGCCEGAGNRHGTID